MSSSLQFSQENCFVEFLNQDVPEANWSQKYNGKLELLAQNHGTDIVIFPSENKLPPADGSITRQKNLVLGIRTADCLPVMMFDPKHQLIGAFHAGWKGVAQSIVPLGIKKYQSLGSNVKNLSIWIGPHIQKKSFEIEAQTLEEILASISQFPGFRKENFFDQTSYTKYNLCLKSVVEFQLLNLDIKKDQIVSTDIDTKTDLSWASYRRDKTTLRNLSSISLRS